MIQITLPDDAKAHQLAAAEFFFKELAIYAAAALEDAPPPLKPSHLLLQDEQERRAAEHDLHLEVRSLSVAMGGDGHEPLALVVREARKLLDNSSLRQHVAPVTPTPTTVVTAPAPIPPAAAGANGLNPLDNPAAGVGGEPAPFVQTMPAAFGDAPASVTPTSAPAPLPLPLPAPAASAPIPAAAPATAETSPAPSAAGMPLDSAGIPWDARIHSESKKQNADGTWRKRSKLPEGRYEEVLAQIKGLMAASTGAPPTAAPAPSTPIPGPASSGAPVPIPGTSTTPATPSADASISRYSELMTWLTIPMTTGANPITVAEVGAKLKALGELYSLPTAPDLQSLKFAPIHVIDNVWAVFRQMAAERGYSV